MLCKSERAGQGAAVLRGKTLTDALLAARVRTPLTQQARVCSAADGSLQGVTQSDGSFDVTYSSATLPACPSGSKLQCR